MIVIISRHSASLSLSRARAFHKARKLLQRVLVTLQKSGGKRGIYLQLVCFANRPAVECPLLNSTENLRQRRIRDVQCDVKFAEQQFLLHLHAVQFSRTKDLAMSRIHFRAHKTHSIFLLTFAGKKT